METKIKTEDTPLSLFGISELIAKLRDEDINNFYFKKSKVSFLL